MKYIIFQSPGGLEFPVLFSGHLSHADMAAIFAQDRHAPVSAGFVRFQTESASTHDRSHSLNLSPRPGDGMFIGAHYRATLGSVGVKLTEPGRWHISDRDAEPRLPETVPASSCVYCPGPHEPISGTHCPDCPARQR